VLHERLRHSTCTCVGIYDASSQARGWLCHGVAQLLPPLHTCRDCPYLEIFYHVLKAQAVLVRSQNSRWDSVPSSLDIADCLDYVLRSGRQLRSHTELLCSYTLAHLQPTYLSAVGRVNKW
jgi:hypothetical protein